MHSPMTMRNRAEPTDNLVMTLRVLIAISALFVSMFIMNHMLLSTLSGEASSSKVFVFNRIAKFEDEAIREVKRKIDEWGLRQPLYVAANDPVTTEKYPIIDPEPVRPVVNRPPTLLPTLAPTVAPSRKHVEVSEAVVKNHNDLSNKPDPALKPFKKGTVVKHMADFVPHQLTCPHGELLQFWKPLSQRDLDFETPYTYKGPGTKYVIFEPDEGGWNNIRMQMELVLVFALATGRTLVLPPDQPMYLLNQGKGHQKEHSFADFFPFEHIRQRLPVISMEEFMHKEGVRGEMRNIQTGKKMYPYKNQTTYDTSGKRVRLLMWNFIRNVSYCPKFKGAKEFLIIPPGPGVNVSHFPPEKQAEYKRRRDLFAANRTGYYYDDNMHKYKAIHFISDNENNYRLLEHFYSFIHFEDPFMEQYYKRFVRDFIHYVDIIFCKAALIINEILKEGDGVYNSFHIRRGDFQFKIVKIPAEQMLHNVGQFLPKNQLVYIASDEKNASYFDPFLQRFPKVRFLSDYFELAGLKDINPNYLGMIDQVITTRGQIFVGTWFSTFTGYITRMRGYMGYSDQSDYFGDMAHRDRYHKHELPMFPFYMREWNVSWYNID